MTDVLNITCYILVIPVNLIRNSFRNIFKSFNIKELYLRHLASALWNIWRKSFYFYIWGSFYFKIFNMYVILLLHFFFFFFWPYQVACGILVPWPGIKPVLPPPQHWKHSFNLCTAREVPVASYFFGFISFFLAALGLPSWAKARSSWGGYTLFAVYGLLTAVAFLVGEHRL